MKLHENQNDFIAAIQSTSTLLKIPQYVVEKDYWVTRALLKLSRSQVCRGNVVFKGGTSLSKGHRLIKRFSEDIDIALRPQAVGKGGFPDNQGQSLYKVIEEVRVEEFELVDEKKADKISAKEIFKRVYTYPLAAGIQFPEKSAVHQKIVIEATLFGDPSPDETVPISSLIESWLRQENRHQDIDELELTPFEMPTAAPEKTFCEKILAVMRRAEGPRDELAARSRHFYDLHKLISSDRILQFLGSQEKVKEYMDCAVRGDTKAVLFSERGLTPDKYKLFADTRAILKSIEPEYQQLSAILYDDELPSEDEIHGTIMSIRDVLQKV